jgi:hypothetical protein
MTFFYLRSILFPGSVSHFHVAEMFRLYLSALIDIAMAMGRLTVTVQLATITPASETLIALTPLNVFVRTLTWSTRPCDLSGIATTVGMCQKGAHKQEIEDLPKDRADTTVNVLDPAHVGGEIDILLRVFIGH